MRDVYDIYVTVRDECEVPMAEKMMGELLKEAEYRFPRGVPMHVNVTVTAGAKSENFLDVLTEEEKADRRRALVAARWKGGENGG
jgi:hypothetical protein